MSKSNILDINLDWFFGWWDSVVFFVFDGFLYECVVCIEFVNVFGNIVR